MQIALTFDIEVWCRSWATLDRDFPDSFDRYIFGRSRRGQFALPRLLETLDRDGLHGIFFVEPLFAGRFGVEPLATIVGLIRAAGQEVQLHLHPEWTDEARTPWLPDAPKQKRQHLAYYSLEEQARLIEVAAALLEQAGAPRPTAFRAGSFAANADTYPALQRNGVLIDSSVNMTLPQSIPDMRRDADHFHPFTCSGISVYPMSVFRDGLGRLRHAQIGACSFAELSEAIECAAQLGWRQFVLLAHNFELLKSGSNEPDGIVCRRFERLARFLRDHAEHFPTSSLPPLQATSDRPPLPHVGVLGTGRRHLEQLIRRIG